MAHKPTHSQIVEVADQLFYEQGFEHTSFADIAAAVGISRGNFYYHFKAKDDILQAVIERRLVNTQQMLDQWEAEGETPQARIQSFINILIMNRVKIKKYGCPVGTLCAELAKLDHSLQSEANRLFTLFRQWLRRQFVQLGYKREADAQAMYVLVFSQGVATLANAFHDERLIRQEAKRLCDWVDTHGTASHQ